MGSPSRIREEEAYSLSPSLPPNPISLREVESPKSSQKERGNGNNGILSDDCDDVCVLGNDMEMQKMKHL